MCFRIFPNFRLDLTNDVWVIWCKKFPVYNFKNIQSLIKILPNENAFKKILGNGFFSHLSSCNSASHPSTQFLTINQRFHQILVLVSQNTVIF